MEIHKFKSPPNEQHTYTVFLSVHYQSNHYNTLTFYAITAATPTSIVQTITSIGTHYKKYITIQHRIIVNVVTSLE